VGWKQKVSTKIECQTHIQLAIYARLVERNTSSWPAVAYFILREPELLTTADNVFPGVEPHHHWRRIHFVIVGASLKHMAMEAGSIEAGSLELVMVDRSLPTDLSRPVARYPSKRWIHAITRLCIWRAGAQTHEQDASLYQRGAGSGKTFRLTEILHQMLEDGRVRPSGILATTFTNKAAAELRERIRSHLIRQRQFTLATAIGQARIGTVNSVCGNLLARFAFEAGMPLEQRVLDESRAAQI